MHRLTRFLAAALVLSAGIADPAIADKELLWGDTHLHSSNSFDAFLNENTTADPDTAYRYAKGLPVVHPYHRARVQIETPLDFLVIADHAEMLGAMPTIVSGDGIPREDLGFVDGLVARYIEWFFRDAVESGEGAAAFASLLPAIDDVEEAAADMTAGRSIPNLDVIARSTWQAAIETADRHNDPGKFTTLIGWGMEFHPRRREPPSRRLHECGCRRRLEVPALLVDRKRLPGRSLDVARRDDGRHRCRVHGDPPQLEHFEGLHVPVGDPARPEADRRGLGSAARALGDRRRSHAVQGRLGDPPGRLARRSLRRLRDLPALHPERSAALRPRSGGLHPLRASRRTRDRGAHRLQPVPLRPDRRDRRSHGCRLGRRAELLGQDGAGLDPGEQELGAKGPGRPQRLVHVGVRPRCGLGRGEHSRRHPGRLQAPRGLCHDGTAPGRPGVRRQRIQRLRRRRSRHRRHRPRQGGSDGRRTERSRNRAVVPDPRSQGSEERASGSGASGQGMAHRGRNPRAGLRRRLGRRPGRGRERSGPARARYRGPGDGQLQPMPTAHRSSPSCGRTRTSIRTSAPSTTCACSRSRPRVTRPWTHWHSARTPRRRATRFPSRNAPTRRPSTTSRDRGARSRATRRSAGARRPARAPDGALPPDRRATLAGSALPPESRRALDRRRERRVLRRDPERDPRGGSRPAGRPDARPPRPGRLGPGRRTDGRDDERVSGRAGPAGVRAHDARRTGLRVTGRRMAGTRWGRARRRRAARAHRRRGRERNRSRRAARTTRTALHDRRASARGRRGRGTRTATRAAASTRRITPTPTRWARATRWRRYFSAQEQLLDYVVRIGGRIRRPP